MAQKKLLITGSSGFIGSFLVEEGLRRGYDVYAGVRRSSSKNFLQDKRIHFFETDFSNPGLLQKSFADFTSQHGKFDYIIHNAGVTKAKKSEEYLKVNCGYTKNFVEALVASNSVPQKFVFISSLAAFGPGNKDKAEPIRLTDIPSPLTSYGKSKLAAEKYLFGTTDFPFIIIRPTNVYGPRERDIYIFFKLLNRHIEPYIGFHKQNLSFIFVHDLVKAIYMGMESPITGKAYFAADGNAYDSWSLGNYIRKNLNKKTIRFSVPVSLVRVIAAVTESFGGASALNSEKVDELESNNWLCDAQPLMDDTGFKPDYDLEKGVKATIEWYKKEGWL